ncbi:MAG: peptidoglycan D,D-transpeptidase FtsI family protein [Candidatus Moraniibacteriota bacterium]
MKNNNKITNAKKGGASQYSRTSILFLLFCGALVVVILKLYYVQVIAYDRYMNLAERQHKMEKNLVSSRGEIFLKNRKETYPLGVNKEYFLAYISPRDVEDEDIEKSARDITHELDVDFGRVMQKFAKRKDVYEVIKHKVERVEVDRINELNIDGLHFIPEYFRFYPGGTLASHVVGFVGSDGNNYIGRYGIESYFDDELQGLDGKIIQERDARGGWLTNTDRIVNEEVDGSDIYLTIDHNVQYEVERILEEAVKEFDAEDGSVIVMEPKTGKILALANYPSFVPNKYNEVENVAVFRNSIVSEEYESGSVFKPITIAMGLDDNKISPDTTYVDTGSVFTAEYQIQNSEDKIYGKQTMTQVLEESLNTGVIYVEKLVGNKKFKEYIERFGFGAQTGIELPAEADGNISNLSYINRHVEFFTASFGQGITMTQLQLATAYSALANGGNLMKPQIIEKKIHSNGEEEIMDSHVVHRVISEGASKQIGEMLRSVVVNGHGKRADVSGYLIGGKTGTAQVANTGKKGYDDAQTIGTFAGYGPIDDPQFVIVVRIDNPKTVIWAESSAAPTFGKIMKYLLDFYNISPTEEIVKK